jgi:hypothetical protein
MATFMVVQIPVTAISCCGAHNADSRRVCQVRHEGAGAPARLSEADAVDQFTSYIPTRLATDLAEMLFLQLEQSQTTPIPVEPPSKQPAPEPDNQISKPAGRRRKALDSQPAFRCR